MRTPKYLPALAILIASLTYSCTKAPTEDPTPTFTVDGTTYKIVETKTGLPTCKFALGGNDKILGTYTNIVGVVTNKFNGITLKNFYVKFSSSSQTKSIVGSNYSTSAEFGVYACNLPTEYQVEGTIVKIDFKMVDYIGDISFSPYWGVLDSTSKLSK